MNKNIAIALVAIAAIAVFFFGGAAKGTGTWSGNFSLPFSFGGAKLPTLENAFTVTEAWSVFQDYLKAAKDHDIDKVKALSYQLSETCENKERREECNTLMEGVYLIANGFKLEDFTNVAEDDRQIIMSTEYMKMGEGIDDTKVVLYFVRAEGGSPASTRDSDSTRGGPKVLGIRFCYGEDGGLNKCTITDPQYRDADKDGWWDDVEALFYK